MRPCIHDGRVCQARLKLTTFCFSYRGTSPGFAFYLLFSWSPAHAFTLATGVSTHLSILQPIFYWILIPWIMAGSEHFSTLSLTTVCLGEEPPYGGAQ